MEVGSGAQQEHLVEVGWAVQMAISSVRGQFNTSISSTQLLSPSLSSS